MKKLRLVLASLTFLALPMATTVVVPQAVSATDEDLDNVLIAQSYVFGGAVGGISYYDLWGSKPPASLYISDSVTSMSSSVYFANRPRFGSDGFPVTGTAELRYRWTASNCAGGLSREVSEWKVVSVPVHPSTHIIGVPLPSAIDTVDLAPTTFADCTMLRAEVEEVTPNTTVGSSVRSVKLSFVPPEGLPSFDPATDPDGRIALYTLAYDDELDRVQMTGALSEVPAGAFRYFFTSCAAARNVLGTLANPGGIVRIRTSAQGIAEEAMGVIAKKSGASDVHAWGLRNGMGVADAEAERVTGAEPFCAT